MKISCSLGHRNDSNSQYGNSTGIWRDVEGGEPPSGWVKVGLKDYAYANLGAFASSVGFYSLALWLSKA